MQNAFSERLGELLFDFFRMLVVDLLHEFEIGVWKAIFIHMLRILQAEGGEDLVAELNRRYVPHFGIDQLPDFVKVSAKCRRSGEPPYASFTTMSPR